MGPSHFTLLALLACTDALIVPIRTPNGPALVLRTLPLSMQAEPPAEGGVVGDPEGATELAPDEKDGYQTYYDDEKVRATARIILSRMLCAACF